MPASNQSFRAVVSVHDVMPDTLPQIKTILDKLSSCNVSPVTILVVPGMQWSAKEIDWLRDLQSKGVVIAGHGWQHSVSERKTLYHKLHGLFLSRMVAEHLSLSEQEIADLIRRCFDWFIEHEFEPPPLYVPPAWAMGRIKNSTLDTLPFDMYENFGGVYRAGENGFTPLPLTGYEADNILRTCFLNRWNRFSEERAKGSNRPLRITIHPHDLSLGLANQIDSQLRRAESFVGYHQLFAPLASAH